jgi:hypothetical protein
MILNRPSIFNAVLLMMLALLLFSDRNANATCNSFAVYPSNDTGWSFNVAAGVKQSKYVLIENLSDSNLTFLVTYPAKFGVDLIQGKIAIKAHDTASFFLSFQPPAGTASGSYNGVLTISKYYVPSCSWTMNL